MIPADVDHLLPRAPQGGAESGSVGGELDAEPSDFLLHPKRGVVFWVRLDGLKNRQGVTQT